MAKDRKRLLIVDGFNVLRSGSRYKNVSLDLPDYEPIRQVDESVWIEEILEELPQL